MDYSPNFNHVRADAINSKWDNLVEETSSRSAEDAEARKILGEDYDESEFSLDSILAEFGSGSAANKTKKDAEADDETGKKYTIEKPTEPKKYDVEDNHYNITLDMNRSPFRDGAERTNGAVESKSEEMGEDAEDSPMNLADFLKTPYASESSISAAKAERIIAEIDHEIAEQEKALEEAVGRMVQYEGIRDDIDTKLAPANVELEELKKDTEPSWADYFSVIGSVAMELAKEKFKRPENRDLTSFHERITNAFKTWEDNRASIKKNEEDYQELRDRKVQNDNNLIEARASISEIEDKIASLKSEKAMHEGSKIILEAAGNEEESEFFKYHERKAAAADLDGKSAEANRADIEARRADMTEEYDDYIEKVDAQIALLSGPSFARSEESSEDKALREALEKRKAEVTKKYEQEMYKLDIKKNTYDRIFPGSRQEKSKGLLKRLNIKAVLEAAKKRRLINALNQYYGDLDA